MTTPSRKLMLLGEIGVGKTSLLRRLVRNEFSPVYKPTIGVELYRYEVTAAGPNRNQSLNLVIWDTDGNFGQTMFRHVYCKGASAALIVGDATRRSTQVAMSALAGGFEEAFPGRPLAFVVNKCDLLAEGEPLDLPDRLVQGREPVLRTSALTGDNVEGAFTAAATIILRREA